MDPLPRKVWKGDKNEDGNAAGAGTGPEDAALRAKQQSGQKRDEEEDG